MIPSIKEDLNYLLARLRPDLHYQRKIKQKGDAWSVIEWFGFEGTFKIISFQGPAMGRDIFKYSRLLRVPSNLVSNA